MIINPVMMRSTLRARGAHAAIVSVMNVSPGMSRDIGIASKPSRKADRHKKNWGIFARQQRNNADAEVFIVPLRKTKRAGTIRPSLEAAIAVRLIRD
jgi:hypothetical protein